jgi:hypothetical protein
METGQCRARYWLPKDNAANHPPARSLRAVMQYLLYYCNLQHCGPAGRVTERIIVRWLLMKRAFPTQLWTPSYL